MARRRPQPNARRGLIRAGLTGIVLVIVAILAVVLVSSLTASTAKAPGSTTIPTPPATPGPLTTPTAATVKPTSTPPTTGVPTAHPGATTSATKKQKDVSYLRSGPTGRPPLMERRSEALLRQIPQTTTTEATARGKIAVAQFRVSATRRYRAPLFLNRSMRGTADATKALRAERHSGRSLRGPDGIRGSGTSVNAGLGDPYVRPVWSNDGRRVLFVLNGSNSSWSLLQYDLSTHQRTHLATVRALDAEPLGWLRGSPLFTITSQADTSLMTAARGGLRQVSILMPQAVTSAQMSPDGRFIGFAVPANCRQTCTLDWFNTRTLKTHFGPTGVSNETAFGWMKDGRSLFAVLNRQLTVLNATSGNAVSYTLPSNLPPRLFHVFRGVSTGSKTVVYDTATGARYVGNMAVSH